MKKFTIGLVLAALLVPTLANAEQKLGIVNVREVLEKSEMAKTVSTELQSEFSDPQSELQSEEQRFMKKRASLERESATLSEDERQAMERDLAMMQRELQVKQIEFNDSFNHRQQEEMQKFMAQLKDVIDDYAAKESFDMIFPSDMSVYFSESNDITRQIISRLDAKA
ncbi:MAG: hypothetical protein CMF48_06050 [Legionellales bacterium]|nr:hypothetical protein [Legionellales bacterium]